MSKSEAIGPSQPHSSCARTNTGSRKTVIYVGGFGLPDRTASAQRCLGNAKLLRSIGFEVIIVGKLSAEPPSRVADMQCVIDGFACYDIRGPFPGRKYGNYVRTADPVEAVLRHVEPDRIHSVIAYNYPALGLAKLMQCSRRLGIPTVVECTEWYAWEGRSVLRNILRIVGSFWRARVLARRAGNVIVASRYLLQYYERKNVLVLPFVVDALDGKWSAGEVKHGDRTIRRFVYAGSPGLGLRKDKISYLLESLAILKEEGFQFQLDVVGLTQAQYTQAVPSHDVVIERLGRCVRFHGRVSHRAAIELQRAADFSVFFRDPDRMTNVGFPTKYVEAVACGIPSITNPTSDIPDYLIDGVNGFLSRSHGRIHVADALRRALRISDAELADMKSRLADNPFHYEHWRTEVQRFMSAIQ